MVEMVAEDLVVVMLLMLLMLVVMVKVCQIVFFQEDRLPSLET